MKPVPRRWLLLAAILCQRAFAADAEYKLVRVEPAGHFINVRLPLTDVTGKVRVKHRVAGGLGEPVSPVHTPLGGDDYLEWQIGYDTLDPNHPSVAATVRFQREGVQKYGCELAKILLEARRLGIITNKQLLNERNFLQQARATNLEEAEKISLAAAPEQIRSTVLPKRSSASRFLPRKHRTDGSKSK